MFIHVAPCEMAWLVLLQHGPGGVRKLRLSGSFEFGIHAVSASIWFLNPKSTMSLKRGR